MLTLLIHKLSDVLKAAERGYIKAIDGRKIKVDSTHVRELLLQSSAGVIAKRWMVTITKRSYPPISSQLAFIHDELQFECNLNTQKTFQHPGIHAAKQESTTTSESQSELKRWSKLVRGPLNGLGCLR